MDETRDEAAAKDCRADEKTGFLCQDQCYMRRNTDNGCRDCTSYTGSVTAEDH